MRAWRRTSYSSLEGNVWSHDARGQHGGEGGRETGMEEKNGGRRWREEKTGGKKGMERDAGGKKDVEKRGAFTSQERMQGRNEQ